MSEQRIYLDQCVLGDLANKKINLPKDDNYHYIYSDTHFKEFSHHKNPGLFLDVLRSINARYLQLNLDEHFKYTGGANISQEDPDVCFQNYKTNLAKLNFFNPDLLYPLILWANGADNIEGVKELPEEIQNQISNLLKNIGLDNQSVANLTRTLHKDWGEVSKYLLSVKHKQNEAKKALISDRQASNIKVTDPLTYIWENLVEENIRVNMSSDQFYGFEPLSGQEACGLYYQIVKCCQMLDIIGFHAERKRRKKKGLPNVQADAVHIANAICFCHELVTADQRLAKRAKAIKEYKDLGLIINLLR